MKQTALTVLFAGVLPASATTLEELAARLEALETKVDAYERRYGPLDEKPRKPVAAAAKPTPSATVDAASDEDINALFSGPSSATTPLGDSGWAARTKIGGYGEMHFQQDLGGGNNDQIDYHRWVLFLNHSFSDRIKLYSELELEHSLAADGAPGAMELEQAYIDFTLDYGLNAKAGLVLLPLGFLNETHEPDTFFGVERSTVENVIIPTTWWEGGLGLSQTLENGLGWDVLVHSSLDVPTTGSNAFRIRSGRQKVAEAPANEPSVTARLRYNGVPGLSLSLFGQYQNDITQTTSVEDNSAVLVGGSAVYQAGGFGLRALVAAWEVDGANFAANDADSQWGAFIEPSYTWTIGQSQKLGVFGRYSRYNYARGIGNAKGGLFDEFIVGLSYWPTNNVVLKADYNHTVSESNDQEDSLNLGVGYSF